MKGLFRNRKNAGQLLAARLNKFLGRDDVVVLALPRGGVPVAFEVARHLHLPLDVFVVRKLGVPGHEELAMGAIASGGATVWNEEVVRMLDLSPADMEEAAERESGELLRREDAYRRHRPSQNLRGKTILLVDDGIATGSTVRAAVAALRKLQAARIVVAVPVAAASTIPALRQCADEVIAVQIPEYFWAVGQWYMDFSQTTDREVQQLLERSHPKKAA
jgi:putative phosphoribosyl transferase